MDEVMGRLPPPERVAGAICRVQVEFAQEHEALLDEKPIRDHFADAFDLRILKHRLGSNRSRLPSGVAVETLTPEDLLRLYWRTKDQTDADIDALIELAREVRLFGADGIEGA